MNGIDVLVDKQVIKTIKCGTVCDKPDNMKVGVIKQNRTYISEKEVRQKKVFFLFYFW